MLETLLTLNGLVMVGLPFLLGVVLVRKFNVKWRVFFIGMGTFIMAQIGHVPFNAYLLNPLVERFGLEGDGVNILGAVLLGLSAGVFEEVARYFVYRRWLKEEHSWAEGVMFGTGHGGIEAAILGVIALIGLFQALTYRGADLSTLIADPADLARAQAQLEAYWSTEPLMAVMGALERIMAMALHISATLLVLQAVRRKNLAWLAAAIGWHALIDAVVVYGVSAWGVYEAEGALAVLSIFSVALIFLLRSPEDKAHPRLPDPEEDSLPPIAAAELTPHEKELDPQDLEDSRYG
jgi:uncharacterized membrane protein YhfC